MEDVVEFKNGKRGRRPEEDVPRLPARAVPARRRLLVRHPQHARRHRLRRGRRQAVAAAPQGRRELPRHQGRGPEAAAAKIKPRMQYEMGETVRVKDGPFADFSGEVIETQRRAAQGQGARQHLRPRDPGRARVQPGREAVDGHAVRSDRPTLAVARGPDCIHRSQEKSHGQEEGRGSRQDPDPRRAGHARPRPSVPRSVRTAWRSWTSARRTTPQTESQRGTIIPVEITIFEDRTFSFITKTPPTPVLLRQRRRHREGRQHPGHPGGRHDHRRPAHRDRPDQDARPQRLRPRGGQAPGRRHRPLDGHQDRADARQRPPSAHRRRTSLRPEHLAATHRGSPERTKPWLKASDTPMRSSATTARPLHAPARRSNCASPSPRPSSTRPIDLVARLGVDPRKADQIVRGTVALPSGTGKDVRVAVFAQGDAGRGRP